jgi:predicted nucleic acid-binding protein
MSNLNAPSPHEALINWYESINETDIYFGAVTIMERRKGIEKLRKTKPAKASEIERKFVQITEKFSDRIIAIDEPIAQEWGKMLGGSEKHIMDTSIAATAKVKNLIVVTLNIRDYRGRGISALDPSKDDPRAEVI